MNAPEKLSIEAAQVLSGLADTIKTLEILVVECGPNLALLDVCRERVEESKLPGSGAERSVRALEVVSRALQFLGDVESTCLELFQVDSSDSQTDPSAKPNAPGSGVLS